MALSSELMQRLEADEPLPKRLRLAENAFCSMELALNRKHDIILEWLCSITPIDTVAWKSLNFCIHCQSSNDRTNLTRRTKTILIDTLINQLKLVQNENLSEKILDSCNGVLSALEMQHFFQTKINKLGLFLQYLFVRIKSDDDQSKTKSIPAHTCVLNAIDTIVKIHKQYIDKDKLAKTFLDYVLAPLCALVDPNCKDNSNRVGAEAHKCMQQILFGKGRYAEYKEYFKEKSGGFLPAELFRTINKQMNEIKSDYAPNMINCVFRAAVGSYKNDSLLVDNLFRELVNISGDFKTVVSNSFIEYLADVPLEYANKIDEISLTDFLGNLIDETLNKENFSDEEYGLVRQIAALNPLVAENKIPAILKKVLLQKRIKETEEQSYVLLMISILDASSRLRREQKLVPWILLALHECLRENEKCNVTAAQILPNDFIARFINFASRLNSSQITAMLKSLTFHLKSNCVEEYGKKSSKQVSLMAECTVSLLVAFFDGIVIFEHTVPLAMQQKFAVALGQLGDVLTALAEKISSSKHDGRIMVVLFEAVLSWSKIQTTLDNYVPNSGAGNIRLPISENELKQLIQRAEDFGDVGCKNALNSFLFHRTSVDLQKQNQKKSLNVIIGKLEDCWSIIINDYPELVSLLDNDQLSELASLILKDIIANSTEKWRKTFEGDNLQENEKFDIAILCHALIKIGSIIGDSTSAAITAQINLNKILEGTTNEATVPALNRKKLIRDIIQLPNLSKDDSSTIKKCLETLLCVPLISLNVPLRTMTFVTIYVISRECESDEEIKNSCEKILFDTLEEGGLNVFDFIDSTSMLPRLPGSNVLQKVFKMSLRNVEPSASLEHLSRSLDSCPEEAAPEVLSCIDNLKSKLNNEQKLALGKIEKKLGKKVLSKEEKNLKSAQKIRNITVSLKLAIGSNKVKNDLKKTVRSVLDSTFGYEEDDKENLSDGKNELMKEGLELAIIALQQRARLDLPEELVSDIWTMVLRYPDARLLTPLLEASVPKVFNSVLITLQCQTEMEMRDNDIAKLSKTLGIWNSIFISDMGNARNKPRLNAMRKLLQSLQMVNISVEHWPDLIKLLLAIVSTKHMQLPAEYVEMIILSAARSLREGNLAVYDEVLILCLALLRSRSEMVIDRLALLVQLYQHAIALITREAKNGNTIDRNQLSLCALNIEKVTGALVKLKRDVLRICPEVISALVDNFAQEDLPGVIKAAFENCINNLMSVCDSHGASFLSRVLPPAKREIFKGLSENYNKHHRYTGKI